MENKENKKKGSAYRLLLALLLCICLAAAVIWGISLEELRFTGSTGSLSTAALVFSEICTKNETVIADNDGRYRD